jgi:hypothetical protein
VDVRACGSSAPFSTDLISSATFHALQLPRKKVDEKEKEARASTRRLRSPDMLCSWSLPSAPGPCTARSARGYCRGPSALVWFLAPQRLGVVLVAASAEALRAWLFRAGPAA